MEDIAKLIDLVKDMGLKGSELADFVNIRETMIREAEKQKQNIEREERAKEREERMKDKEYKENERQALLKIELAQKQIELAKINADSKTGLAAKSPDVKAKIPKLPSFNEERDNMDSYLKRFERFAKMLNGRKKNGLLIYHLCCKVRHWMSIHASCLKKPLIMTNYLMLF